jgi:ABC-2 type transport system permease protein
MSGISSSQTVNLGLVITGEASADVLKEIVSQVGTIMITDLPNKEALEEALGKQDVDFGLVWNGSLLTFSYDPARIQDNYAFQELARGIASKFELRHQELYPILGVDKVHVGKPSASNWFNLAVPGVMAFSILSGGLFAVSGHLTAMKQRKLLDRLIVTPMRPIALLVAIATVRLVIIYFSSLITLLTAIIILRLTFAVDWLNYTVFVLAATAGSMGFGTVIALLVRSPSSASNLGYITSIMMMFLAGIYFPIEVMPAYLRTLSKFLPLTYMANAMRYATGVSEMSSSRFWAITASLGLVFLVSFPLLARYVVRADRA